MSDITTREWDATQLLDTELTIESILEADNLLDLLGDEKLGKIGDIVEVKNGYARNYLIPQSIAALATEKSEKILQRERVINERRLGKQKKAAEQLAAELEKLSLTATVNVGEEDKVFGSVTSQMVADLLSKEGYEIDKRKILLDEPIKALGIYDVKIKLQSEVEGTVKIWVVKE